MNDNPNTPQYYRLLEKGETLQAGDILPLGKNFEPAQDGIVGTGTRDSNYLRPIICDEWIPYAERKPTREDFEPTGKIDGFTKLSGALYTWGLQEIEGGNNELTFWRKITPPQPAKPKSVECRVWNTRNANVTTGLFSGTLTLNADGTANLGCGDVIAADCLDEIFKARNSVMEKGL